MNAQEEKERGGSQRNHCAAVRSLLYPRCNAVQTFAFSLSEQVSTVAASAAKMAEFTSPMCPDSVCKHSPLAVLQTFAECRPGSLKRHHLGPGCAIIDAQCLNHPLRTGNVSEALRLRCLGLDMLSRII